MLKKLQTKIRKIIGGGLSVLMVTLLLASCGAKVSTEELELRDEGISCLNSGDYEGAIKKFNEALSCTSSVTDVELDINLYKARAQFLNGNTEDAFITYTGILNYKKYSYAYYQRGNLFLATGDYNSAISDYDDAIDVDDENYELYIGIYESLHAYGYDDVAVTYLEKGKEISGERGKDHLYKGIIEYYLGNTDEAIRLLENAVDQNQSRANFYLSDIYRSQGDTEKATSYLNAYMECEDVDADELVSAGQKQLEAGNYKEAIMFLEAAQKSDNVTDRGLMLKCLAIAYENSGDFASALTLLEAYIQEFPEDYQAEEEIVFLKNRVN